MRRGSGIESVTSLGVAHETAAAQLGAGSCNPRDTRRGRADSCVSFPKTPIVNHPEVAILSVGRVAERPVVRDGQVTIAPVGYVALTFDHRVVDGARAAGFGLAVIRRLEKPIGF